MNNANIIPSFLPKDQVFRYVDHRPAASLPELERKHDGRLDDLQEKLNKLATLVESRLELDRKSDTRHNLGVNTGFRKVTSGVPESWTSAGAGATFSQQAVRPGGNTANYSARIAAGGGAVATLKQTVPVFPGQRFSMAGWVKVVSGTGLISLVTNGTNPMTSQIKLSVRGGAAGGFEAFPSPYYDAPMVELPTDATTVTLTLQADTSSTIDFCEIQYGHGTQRVPHLWVANENDPLPLGGVVTTSSGDWTATLTGVANITAANWTSGMYSRVGNYVTFSGKLTIDPAAGATLTQLGITVPVASAFANANQAIGTGEAAAINVVGQVISDVANARMQLEFVSDAVANQQTWQITGQYKVI